MMDKNIKKLVQYGINTGLIPKEERIYSTNMLLDLLGKEDFSDPVITDEEIDLDHVLKILLDEACKMHLIEDSITERDLFDTKLMNCIMPRPSQLVKKFWDLYNDSPKTATDFFYHFSQSSNYIRKSRIVKDLKWKVPSIYGNIDITINLSKPEKDPKAIAAAKNTIASTYPKCPLCMENEGYAGTVTKPARQNLRIVPIPINNSQWGFQYSPYVYYNEHCIVFDSEHTPMKINRDTFIKLLDFIKLFPHYFLGSNADLPIVGGSILSHDHFQGGNYTFPMARAGIIKEFTIKGYEDVAAGILKWPLSVIRLKSRNTERLVDMADYILTKWRSYTDEEAFIFSETDGEPHNTITPIARYRNGMFELDLTLRNNITTKDHPFGVYHPHANLHHIKKENIGLIEVMGLAVLPSRLKREMELLANYILSGKKISDNPDIEKHSEWVSNFLPAYSDVNERNIMNILQKEIGKVFVQVLEDSGVYKCTPDGIHAFMRFLDTLQ